MYNIKNPAIAIRFVDFPTLLINAKLDSDGNVNLESGKRTSFSMHSDDLQACLETRPACVMFVDADPGNVSICGKYSHLSTYSIFLNKFKNLC